MPKVESLPFWARAYCALGIAIGSVLAAGGAYLILLGGSAYYLLAGSMMIASGTLLLRRNPTGANLYYALLLGTVPWAVWESGLNWWALVPRLLAIAIFGLPTPILARRFRGESKGEEGSPRSTRKIGVVGCLICLAASVGAWLLRPSDPIDPMFQTGQSIATARSWPSMPSSTKVPDGEWLHWGRDAGGTRFSSLQQINMSNVSQLQLAWTARVGPTNGLKATPLMVNDKLFLCNNYNDVIALDGETGKQIWRFNAGLVPSRVPYATCRGVAYYKIPAAKRFCSERIYTNTTDSRLIGLDAHSGKLCTDFGHGGQVPLQVGLSNKPTDLYAVTSAPTIVRGKIVLGGWVTDGQFWGEPAGVVRAFDAVTGQLAWAWDVGRPSQRGLPPAGQTYTHSTPNAWAPFSADEQLGLVYVPTGNPAVDYFGGKRRPFDERFGSSVVAIDAETGGTRWAFRTIYHDLWDWDVASQPTLVDLALPGGVRKALVQATKRGEIFVLDRQNGKPIKPVIDRKVPTAGAVPEERVSAVQPFSIGMPSFRGPDLTERSMWGLTPLDQLWCRIKFKEARYEGTATPPGLKPNIAYPGYNGGIDWGSVSVDPQRGLLFVNSNRVANYDWLISRKQANKMNFDRRNAGGLVKQGGTPYAAQIKIFLSPLGIPCNQPPFGMMAAVDLRSGKLVWSKPLGSARAAGPFGLRSMLPITIGVPNMGGSLATASGLLFIGASQDGDFRAFDSRTGKVMWKTGLPAGGQATPMTYISPRSGRQFVVVSAGGHSLLKTVMGDYVVAYALPVR